MDHNWFDWSEIVSSMPKQEEQRVNKEVTETERDLVWVKVFGNSMRNRPEGANIYHSLNEAVTSADGAAKSDKAVRCWLVDVDF